jgi:hypothetical protein
LSLKSVKSSTLTSFEDMSKQTFPISNIKPGDVVTRLVGELAEMQLVVVRVNEEEIHCGVPGTDGLSEGNYWSFCRRTGAEIDDFLQWGPRYGRTGSQLIGVIPRRAG